MCSMSISSSLDTNDKAKSHLASKTTRIVDKYNYNILNS